MKTLSKTLTAITLTGLFLGLSGPALSDEAAPVSKSIQSSGLDLTQPEGAQILYRRIQSAAHSVCRQEYSDRWDVKRVLRRQQCYEATVETIVNRVDAPELTAAHRNEAQQLAAARQ